jgi:hypothetical protein
MFVLLGACCVTGCGGAKPEKVYQAWSTAVKAGDFAGTWECLAPQTRGTVLQIMVLDSDLLSGANPAAKDAFGQVFTKYGLNPADATFKQVRLQISDAAAYASDLNNILKQYQGELAKLEGSRYHKLTTIWSASAQASLAPSQVQGTRAMAAVQAKIPHTAENATVQAVFEKVNGQWMFAELEESPGGASMAGGPGMLGGPEMPGGAGRPGMAPAGGAAMMDPKAGMPPGGPQLAMAGAAGAGPAGVGPAGIGPDGARPGGPAGALPGGPGGALPADPKAMLNPDRPNGGLPADPKNLPVDPKDMPARPPGAPGGPGGPAGALPADPKAMAPRPGAEGPPADPKNMAPKAGGALPADPKNMAPRPGAEPLPGDRKMNAEGDKKGIPGNEKGMPPDRAGAGALGANPAEGAAGGLGRAGGAGGAGNQNQKFKPGSWEHAIDTFAQRMAAGDFSGLEYVISSKAKGLLGEIRDGALSEERLEDLKAAFAEPTPLPETKKNAGSSVSITIKGKLGHHMTLTVGREDGVFKIRDLKISEPGASRKR